MDFDLNIQNYSLDDLKLFFQLSSSYSISDIEKKEVEMRTLLISSGHIPSLYTRDFILFLTEAKQILRENIPVPKLPPEKSSYPKYLPPPSRQENVILPPQTPFLYTQNSDYFQGTLNPIHTRTIKTCITIDSRFRSSSSSSSDFIVSLPNKLSHVLSLECCSFEIQSNTIPNISVSLGNHFFFMNIKTIDKEYPHIFLLPNGHYNTKYLLYTLNRLFSEQKQTPYPFLEWILDPYGSGKMVILISNNTKDDVYTKQIIDITLDFSYDINGNLDTRDSLTKLGRILGFTQKKYTGKLFYMGETIPNPSLSINYFYLCVDDFINRSSITFHPTVTKTTIFPSTLARISPLVEPIQTISIPRKYFGPVDLTRFQIRIVNAYGQTFDLENTDYSFCLQLDIVYDL